MDAFPRWEIRDLLLLSLVAGSADAAGYMGLGRVFTSNMTGNVVLMGIDLGQGHLHESQHAAYVLAVFLAGVAAGWWMNRRIDAADRPRIVLRTTAAEAPLLILFAVLWAMRPNMAPDPSSYLVSFLAMAMGFQSAAFNRLKISGVATTAITSTITTLVLGALKLVAPPPDPSEKPSSRTATTFQALFLLLYLAGAVLSGVVMLHLPRLIGILPAACVVAVLVSTIQRQNRTPDRH